MVNYSETTRKSLTEKFVIHRYLEGPHGEVKAGMRGAH